MFVLSGSRRIAGAGDQALRMIVGWHARMMELHPMAIPSKTQIERTAKGWAIWWFAEGYQQSTFET